MKPYAIATLLILSSCSARHPQNAPATILTAPARRIELADEVRALPMGGQNIVRKHLGDGTHSSTFLIRIAGQEQPHIHTKYDLSITVAQGHGTLWIDNQPLPMKTGDTAHIPRGVSHHFVNESKVPATAIAVFSPKFTGPDSKPLE